MDKLLLIIRITLDLYGDNFSPHKLLPQLKDSFKLIDSNEKTDIDKIRHRQYDFGALSLQHPDCIGIEYKSTEYQKWYIDFILKNHIAFTTNCVDRVDLFYNVYYSNQCNFEILDKELLSSISGLGISLPISVYQQTKEELIELLEIEGYSNFEIREIFRHEP